MSYIGKTPTPAPLTSSDITDGIITTTKIADDAATADKIANAVNSAITANTSKTTNATHSGEVTGSGALTIADNIVDEANLKVSNSPSNGYLLSAQSGNTGGLTWSAPAGGGKILQVKQTIVTNKQQGSGGYNDVTNLTVAITPSATSSKILVMFSITAGSPNQYCAARLMRGSTAICISDAANSNTQGSVGNFYNTDAKIFMTLSNTFLDSPSSTSEQTYKIQFYCEGNTYYINGAGNDSGSSRVTSPSTITVMEVSA